MMGVCRLCGTSSELQCSHIIPSFIFNWLKSTSATGHIRYGEEINKRVQDGLKAYWLCSECEQMIGRFENYYATSIFRPIMNGEHTVCYDHNLLKFAVSLSWRVLSHFYENNLLNHFNVNQLNRAEDALIKWQEILRNKTNNPKTFEQHHYNFSGSILGLNDQIHTNIHRYLQRSIEIDVLTYDEISLVYTKLPCILIIGYISLNCSGRFRCSRVCTKSGKLAPSKYNFPKELCEAICDKAKASKNLLNSISETQKNKINKSYLENIQKVVDSETIKSFNRDMQITGIDLNTFNINNMPEN